jgi:hypothetical protein
VRLGEARCYSIETLPHDTRALIICMFSLLANYMTGRYDKNGCGGQAENGD